MSAPTDTEAAAPTTRHRWTAWLLQLATVVQILLVFTQAAAAGSFLAGDAGLGLHERLGTEVLTLVALIQVVAAILFWRPGRRSAWPILVAVVAYGLITLQIIWGFDGVLILHVPNALLILTLHGG